MLDNELEPGLIEKDKNGNTYFSFAAIENDEFVLTDIEWEKLLKLMPARDYRRFIGHRAGKQLYALLGGKLSGGRNSSKSHGVREWGTFRSRSDSDYTDHAFALRSYKNYAQFHGFYSKNLCPVRRRVKTVS